MPEPSISVETAKDYLKDNNFKTLLEWITTETILAHPSDPLAFIHSITEEKLKERGKSSFKPTDALEYAKHSYSEASERTDEFGNLRLKDIPFTGHFGGGDGEEKVRLLERLVSVCRRIATELDPIKAANMIVAESCRLLKADRATIFTLDEANEELVLHVAEGVSNIRIKVGQGIAGMVVSTGTPVNIVDASRDPRFDSSVDKRTGYTTKTLLATPIRDAEQRILGVLQVLNKEGGDPFSVVEENIISTLAAQAGIALRNAQALERAVAGRRQMQSVLDLVQAMHSDRGETSLMFTITQQAPQLVQADRCTVFLCDHKRNELVSSGGDVNIQISKSAGIAGLVATTGEVTNIPDAYQDSRFNQAVDKQTGYRTRTILCMPIQTSDGVIVGVIQLINKKSGPFSQDDERIIHTFTKVAAPLLRQSSLFTEPPSSAAEANVAVTPRLKAKSASRTGMGLIQETEEAEEEEGDQD